MAVYLDENMMGRHDDTIGFPHLLSCMGFVARTNNDLWGVHLFHIDDSDRTFRAFWGWAQGKGLTRDAITDIYGCCNRAIRYRDSNPTQNWLKEMKWFAQTLGGYQGSMHGFDTRIINPQHGTYVEYRRQLADGCKIFYELHELTARTNLPKRRDDPGGDVRTFSAKDPAQDNFAHYVFESSEVHSTSGELQEVDYALRLTTI